MTDLTAAHELGRAVTVRDGAVELFRYVYAPDDPQAESPRPYLHPLRTRSGNSVTVYRPYDHVWHKGLSFALPVVGDENFWGGGSYIHGEGYLPLPNNGAQRANGVPEVTVGDRVAISHDLDWITQGGEHWFTERRTLTAALLTAGSWALVFETTMTNVRGSDIPIGSPTTRGRENAGYGGLFWRGPRSFTGGTLVAPGVHGGDELRGQRHDWMGFVGTHDEVDARSMLVMVDDESNLRHPPQWFARTDDFAALSPGQFFSEEHVVPSGGALTLRYGVGIADGAAGADAASSVADLAADVRRAMAVAS